MTALLDILVPGAMTTVQDLGRTGFRGQGVPLAGVLDRVALRLVNALLGNDPGEAAFEVRLTGPRLRVWEAPLHLALGPGVSARVSRSGESFNATPWSTVPLTPGDTVEIRLVDGAIMGLVGIAGGLDLPLVLGSRSTYSRAGIGGVEGRPLVAGDRLRCRAFVPAREKPGGKRRLVAPFPLGEGPIRVLPGPQEDYFTRDALETLFSAEYEVTRDMDRMGIRLNGPALSRHPERGAAILSEGMVPGCIQVPGNGQPILVLADGQTVGGYPKPGVVISADLSRLAAVRPGDRLRFQAVTQEEAEAALTHLDGRIREAIAAITDERLTIDYDLKALQEGNLISGVVDVTNPDHFPGHLEEKPPCA